MRWLLIFLLGGAAALPAAADPVLRWSPADTTLAPGQEATLSVMLDDTLTVRTVELYISYDSGIITSVDGAPGALFSGFSLFSGFQEVDPEIPGQWHGYSVVLGAGDWALGPGELFSWTVRGDTLGVSASVAVSVRLLPPGGGDYETVVLPGIDVRVADPSAVPGFPSPETTLSLYPNPFNPRVRVAFSGPDQGDALLEVYDLRGRRVATLWRGEARAAEQTAWDGRDDRGRALPSGIYTFSLRREGGSRVTARGTLVR
jgi:hypothetical protein